MESSWPPVGRPNWRLQRVPGTQTVSPSASWAKAHNICNLHAWSSRGSRAAGWAAFDRGADCFGQRRNLIGLAQDGQVVTAGESLGIAAGQQYWQSRMA